MNDQNVSMKVCVLGLTLIIMLRSRTRNFHKSNYTTFQRFEKYLKIYQRQFRSYDVDSIIWQNALV